MAILRQRGHLLQDLEVALDDRQQVVEIVCDAARQLADAFEALGMAERLLGLHALQAGRK
ncbi:hypothetical protein D9M72_649260 [compost metagenome]